MARRLPELAATLATYLGPLATIVLAFVGFYGLTEFKDWFNATNGSSLLAKAVVILGLYFFSLSLILWYRMEGKLQPELSDAKSQLASAQAELSRIHSAGAAVSPEAAFIDGITRYVQALSQKGRDQHVLRLRDALSRHLWVEGLLRARVALGDVAERSAAKLGAEEKQVAALVDDLGWTLVAMEDYEKASEKIKLGLRIAERAGLHYWVAKAHRHLSGIATVKHDFPAVAAHLDQSEKSAGQISDEKERDEMLAGIKYARAIALLFEGKYREALDMVDASAQIRTAGGDPTRIVRSFALKGKILLRIGDPTSRGEAKAMFLRGLQEAQSVGRRDEIVRNLNGLAAVAELERDAQAVADLRAQAAELVRETPVPYELQDRL